MNQDSSQDSETLSSCIALSALPGNMISFLLGGGVGDNRTTRQKNRVHRCEEPRSSYGQEDDGGQLGASCEVAGLLGDVQAHPRMLRVVGGWTAAQHWIPIGKDGEPTLN